ncbi:MAG: Hint domain-containing protein, partial [Hyphomicrobiaceae bacterium]
MTNETDGYWHFPSKPVLQRYLNPVNVRRSPRVEQDPMYVDQHLYMTLGPGRYATLDNVPIVQRFFEKKLPHQELPPGEHLLDDVIKHYYPHHAQKDVDAQLRFSKTQYEIDPENADYGQRVLLWNSSAFGLKGRVDPGGYHPMSHRPPIRFVIDQHGRKHIRNAELNALIDNFDLTSDSWIAKMGNYWIKPQVDPLDRGVRIPFNFTGEGPIIGTFTEKDYDDARKKTKEWTHSVPPLLRMKQAVEDEIEYAKRIPCFAAGTPIRLPCGAARRIEECQIGDVVLAFDAEGDVHPARITRLLPGITTEWIELDDGTRVTPGHPYLRPDGSFLAITDIISSDGLVVDAAGKIRHVTGRPMRATDTASDAQWLEPDLIAVGRVLAKQAPVLGWRTYNFTVEGLHTYIAGGYRVHNKCLLPGERVVDVTVEGNGIFKIHAVGKDGAKIEILESIDPKNAHPIVLLRDEYSRDRNGATVRRTWTKFDADRMPIGDGTKQVLVPAAGAGRAAKPQTAHSPNKSPNRSVPARSPGATTAPISEPRPPTQAESLESFLL